MIIEKSSTRMGKVEIIIAKKKKKNFRSGIKSRSRTRPRMKGAIKKTFILEGGCEGVDWVLLAEEGVRWLPEMFHNGPI